METPRKPPQRLPSHKQTSSKAPPKTSQSQKTLQKTDKSGFRILSYDRVMLDRAAMDISDTALSNGAGVSGPIPLPTKCKARAFNKSPHVYGASKDHFKRVTHKRLIIIKGFSSVLKVLYNLTLPPGVDVERVKK